VAVVAPRASVSDVEGNVLSLTKKVSGGTKPAFAGAGRKPTSVTVLK